MVVYYTVIAKVLGLGLVSFFCLATVHVVCQDTIKYFTLFLMVLLDIKIRYAMLKGLRKPCITK